MIKKKPLFFFSTPAGPAVPPVIRAVTARARLTWLPRAGLAVTRTCMQASPSSAVGGRSVSRPEYPVGEAYTYVRVCVGGGG